MRVEENGIEGAFVECGVARGGCSALMASVAARYKRARKTWLFDSFEGLPLPTQKDYDQAGRSTGQHVHPLQQRSCLGTLNEVEELLFSHFSLNKSDIFLVKGWFQDSLPQYKQRVGPISLLRIDGDWYESTKCCLENLYDNVVAGGHVIVDDYGTCYGCMRAVDDFLRDRGLHPQLRHDGRGGSYS
jgi:hypothetical protein